jgi:hypothetical protein
LFFQSAHRVSTRRCGSKANAKSQQRPLKQCGRSRDGSYFSCTLWTTPIVFAGNNATPLRLPPFLFVPGQQRLLVDGRIGSKSQFVVRLVTAITFPISAPSARAALGCRRSRTALHLQQRRSSGESAEADGETWGDLLVSWYSWSLWRFDLLAYVVHERRR